MVDRAVIKTKISFADARLNELHSHRAVTPGRFQSDSTVQAAILHHLQVAVQSCIDMASHLVVHGYDKLDLSKAHAHLLRYRRTIARFLKAVVAYAKL